MLSRLQAAYRRLIPNKQVRHGLPFLAFLTLGWLGVKEFAQIRYDFKKKLGECTEFQEKMERGGLKKVKEVDVEEEYRKMVEDTNLDSWFNIRGPRPGEDSRTIQDEIRRQHGEEQATS